MAKLIRLCNKALNRIGLDLGIFDSQNLKVVSLNSKTVWTKGNVLIAYILDPFLLKDGDSISQVHTHHFESLQIADVFLELGYTVDIIHYHNKMFRPKKKYKFFVSARTNFALIANRLNNDCIKIAHFDTSHYIFNNAASYKRVLELQKRRNLTSTSIRIFENNMALENADYAVILGNEFTLSTYSYGNKPMFSINVPVSNYYPSPTKKDFNLCQKNFLWIGSSGFVHKGLDLVLEAFARMPEYQLYVCGPVTRLGKEFCRQFHKELYDTLNIKTIDWVDVSSKAFQKIVNNCAGVVYPSCAEGQAGAIVTCMRAGLIPIISYESGIDVHNFGVILENCTVKTIMKTIQNLETQNLAQMAVSTWNYAEVHHTNEAYKKRYLEIINSILEMENINRNQLPGPLVK